jgi:probable F420-dependent oxidoreductase
VHPFRFGVQTSGAPDAAAWRERARRIEALGYSTLFMPDHMGDQLGPLVALAVAAEATSTLKVGTLVADNDYRHPVVLARELATLDVTSGGRLEAGIGAGWLRSDYDASGIPYDPPGVRVDRLEEAVVILKSLWSTGTATFTGKHYEVTAADGRPRPVSTPHPPIIIGGGSRRVLQLAAREADIVGINPSLRSGALDAAAVDSARPAYFQQRVQWVREAAGERFGDIELQLLTMFAVVVPNRRELAEQMAPAFGLDPDEALEMPPAVVGTVDEICDILLERRERYGFSYIVIHEGEMEDFAPVVERLAGV